MSVTDDNADLQPQQGSRSVDEAMADLEEHGLVPDLTPPPVVEADTPIDAPFGLMIVRTPRWRVVDGFLLDDEIDISTRPRSEEEKDLPEDAFVTMPSPPKPAQPEHEGIPRGGRA